MSRRLPAALLVSSAALCGAAFAESAAPSVAQIRLPSRGLSVDAIVWASADGAVRVQRETLSALSIAVPPSVSGDQVALSDIPGLSYARDEEAQAYLITCTPRCFSTQRLNRASVPAPPSTRAAGAYLNYDVDADWSDSGERRLAALAEANAFGRLGALQASWVATMGQQSSATRLETRWTYDRPSQRLRLRVGDSVAVNSAGEPFRFGGVQLGTDFGLTPGFVSYPTPTLVGAADSASTVELYVNGVLRARDHVAAGPFSIVDPPMDIGAGQAQVVVTDVLGRQQIVSQPFFVTDSLLRPGLSDWSVALGAPRRRFGQDNAAYGDAFALARYRLGISDSLTAGAAIDAAKTASAQVAVSFAHLGIGRIDLSRTQSAHGAQSEFNWSFDARSWSANLSVESRDRAFSSFAEVGLEDLRRTVAAGVSTNMGSWGAMSVTAAAFEQWDQSHASTLALSYTPDFHDGALSFRALYSHAQRSQLTVGVHFAVALSHDTTGSAGFESAGGATRLSASAQRSPPSGGGFGWRARVETGDAGRLQWDGLYRGAAGESELEFDRVGGQTGVRLSQAGSIGVVDGLSFAGPRIDEAFAVVDAGAPGVRIYRDGFEIGRSGADGRLLAVGLHPNIGNRITLAVDDLPLNRAPISGGLDLAPGDHAGAVARFEDAAAISTETRVHFADGSSPPRGSLLVRVRDNARFPIGASGRVVLRGARNGDSVHLDFNPVCAAAADPSSVNAGIVLICGGAS